jgi:hypothetical protein
VKSSKVTTTSVSPRLGDVNSPIAQNEPSCQTQDTPDHSAFLYGTAPPLENSVCAVGVGTRQSVEPPRLQLETHAERAALRRLKPAWGDRTEQKEFSEFVLARLAMIADARIMKGKTDPTETTTSEVTKRLRRRAERTRRMASVLEKPVDIGFRLRPIFPPPPIRELRLHADSLDHYAKYLQTSGSSLVAPPSGVSLARKRPPRREKTRESEQTMKLVEFVRQHTGEEHWDELVILLRRATGDSGYNNHRLQSLCSFHRRRRKTARRSLLGLFRSDRKAS